MKHSALHRLTAGLVFLISLIQYCLTLQPSVALWDPGELSAAAYRLQISHPPGAPLFSLIGRVFFILPIPGNIGLRVNALSAVSSALAVMLLYLIAVKVIDLCRKRLPDSLIEAVGIYASAAIGALALSFSDTMWFNAVESNVFGLALLFFALIVWLVLTWYQRAKSAENMRIILLIGYLAGLALGVQVMSILSLMIVGMLFIFKRTDDEEGNGKRTALIFIGHILVLIALAFGAWAIETSQIAPSFDEFKSYDLRFILGIGAVSFVVMVILRRRIFRLDSYYTAVASGMISVGLLFIGIMKILPSIGRVLAGSNNIIALVILFSALLVFSFFVKWAIRNNREILACTLFSLIFAIMGSSIYAIVLIRANQHVQMNEGNPDGIARLAPYLNREQYGEWPLFKRRWSVEPQYQKTWTEYKSDLDFFDRYQMNSMFSRYLLWNFAGRSAMVKDSPIDWSQLYGIPLFLGAIGLVNHFRRNWKMASAFLILFILSGFLISFYGNMQDPQPRDRDYYYTGAFFIFALWIALGMSGIIEFVKKIFSVHGSTGKIVYGAMLCMGIVFVPGRMIQTNFHTHDRSRDWLPRDYAYNLLQSCEPGSILFTNGDNDTFPLWYLQDVEGIRTDVRIIDLSLANANWYIRQLKYEHIYNSPKVKIGFADAVIDNIQPVEWEDKAVTLAVPPDIIAAYGITDTSVLRSGSMTFIMPATVRGRETNIVRVQDLVVKNVVEQNLWNTPIYFAVTTALDARIGLGPYLRSDGMALRIMPQKNPVPGDRAYYLNEPVMRKNLIEESPAGYCSSYQPGFFFSGLNDSSICFDDTRAELVQNYRASYFQLAFYYMYQVGDKTLTKKTLDRMEQYIPRATFKMDLKLSYYLTTLYFNVGDSVKFRQVAGDVENLIRVGLSNPQLTEEELAQSSSMLLELYDRTFEYQKAVGVIETLLSRFPDDQELRNELVRYQQLAAQRSGLKSSPN